MDDLVAFLRARLDDSEQVAKAALAGWGTMPFGRSSGTGINAEALLHAALHSPARVLREVAAKRKVMDEYAEALRILDGFRETGYEEGRREALELACRAIALPYADHENYREEWAL